MNKTSFLFILIFLSSQLTAQFEHFTLVDEKVHTNFSNDYNAKIIAHDSTIIVYRFHNNSIFPIYTTDGGNSWQETENPVKTSLSLIDENPFSVIRRTDGKYFFAYVQFKDLYLASSDDGITFNEEVYSQKDTLRNIKLLEDDKENLIIFAQQNRYNKNDENEIYKMISSDGGETWSSKTVTFVLPHRTFYMDVIKFENNNLALMYEGLNVNEFFSVTSTDFGESWNDPVQIINDSECKLNKFLRGEESLVLVYNKFTENNYPNSGSNKIFYKTSDDFGKTWSEEKLFTANSGNHILAGLAANGDNPLIYTRAQRDNYPNYNYFVGNLFKTDVTKEPIVYTLEAISDSSTLYFDSLFTIRSYIEYGDAAENITLLYNSQTYALKDDGQNNDILPNDNFYGIELYGIPDEVGGINKTAINVNNITLPFNSRGVLAAVSSPYPVSKDISLNVELNNGNIKSNFMTLSFYPIGDKNYSAGGMYRGKTYLFSAGFWLSGFANNNLWANGVASAALIEDYLSGPVNSNPDDPTNRIYKITSSSTPFGEEWMLWKEAVNLGARFYDGDNNFTYNPIDHNKNGIWDINEDRPNLIYDEMYFTVFNDNEEEYRRFEQSPMGIEIRQTIFGSSKNSLLNNTIFVRYSLVNRGTVADTLRDVIFTSWQDVDLGNYQDDQTGVDTTLQSTYVYESDNDEALFGIPPAAFFTLVQGPKKYTGNLNDYSMNRLGPLLGEEREQYYKTVGLGTAGFNGRYFWGFMDPNNINELRNYQSGNNSDGETLDPCNSEYGLFIGENCSSTNPFYWFSGDPVNNTGWLSDVVGDIRTILSTEKFDLPINNPTDIIIAYTIDQGGDWKSSIEKTRKIIEYIFEEYDRNFSTIVGVDENAEPLINNYSLSQNYPNPFNPTTSIKYQVSSIEKVSLKVFDILGREIKTLVNEVKSPGSYKVTFDASQLASGVYFYRLTSGSFLQTKKMIVLK